MGPATILTAADLASPLSPLGLRGSAGVTAVSMADADGLFSRLCLLALCMFVGVEVKDMMQQKKPKGLMRSSKVAIVGQEDTICSI